jgi:multidrug efflux pump subunit AcrB
VNRAIAWFAENRVAANLLMIMIIAAGAIAVYTIKLEVFPELSSDIITVSVPYLGAAPEEAEEGVCVRVEEAIQDLEGIDKITSSASEGVGNVTIEVKPGYDTRRLLDDVKSRVDAISTFPEQTEKPVVAEFVQRFQVLNVAVSGQADEKTLKTMGERIRDGISDLPEVSQVELSSARPYEIVIELSEQDLRRYRLTFDEVAAAVRTSSLDLPGGSIRTDAGEISLRAKGQAYRAPDFEAIILRSFPDGTRLALGDVATVVDGFAETDQSALFDGQPSVLVQVYRVGNENALTVAQAVKDYLVRTQPTLPEGIELTTWQDDTRLLKDRLSLLIRSGRAGFLLVFLSLAMFLRLRLALWVTGGMIISFFGAFWVMPQFDVSLNMLSLFAFVLVLGIVVDDAIVVGENIYTQVERGEGGTKAAIRGAQGVGVPVVFAVLTTIAAFSPLLSVPGNMGKFMRVIPVVVIGTLVFSLIESLFILPAHLSHVKPDAPGRHRNGLTKRWTTLRDKFVNGLRVVAQVHYRTLLERALGARYLALAIGTASLILTMGLVAGGWVDFTFLPDVEADNVIAFVTMPEGTPVEVTEQAVRRLEEAARTLQLEFQHEGEPAIEHILASIGEQPIRKRLMRAGGPTTESFAAAHLGEVNMQLVSAEEREVTSPEIGRRWRELTGPIPEAEELTITSSLFSAGEDINIQLAGANYVELQEASEFLQFGLAEYPGVTEIADSYRSGKEEIKLRIRPEAEAVGLTLADLARQVRQAFYGEEAQRVQRGRDDIRVMIRYPELERRSLGDLENMRIRLPDGSEVPFAAAAEVDRGRGFSTITRTDRKRTINITAEVDASLANANDVVADVLNRIMPELLARYPTITYSLEGEQSEQRETLAGLARGFMFALLLIYVLLAIPFRSYAQPLIVMSAIPFGIVGAVWGHVLMGMQLTILSGFGIVALAGVVVNDSLVMVDFVNRERRTGKPLFEAIREAGVARFRPIILTSLTTFAGLTPLLLERSLQAQFLIPMAISLAFGVVFATFITLILVPSIYHILEDIKGVGRRWLGREIAGNAMETSPELSAESVPASD